MRQLADRSLGFEVPETGENFDRQFLWVEARPAAPEPVGHIDVGPIAARVAAFSRASEERLARWREEFSRRASTSGRAALWGAGSKGVTFLNLLPDPRAISQVVDINPHKVGMHIAGTGHRIENLESLAREEAPQLVIVMNPAYVDEIQLRLLTLRLETKCRVA